MGAIAEPLDMSDVDTESLEAVEFGDPVPTQSAAPAPENEGAQESNAGGEPTPAEVSSPLAEPSDPPAPITQDPEPETPTEPEAEFENMADDERRALDIRRRNPDLTLEAALTMAREQLGSDEDGDQAAEPTLENRIAEIEQQMDEAGANEGLFTSEIANLTKEHARLLAEQAAQNAVAQVRQNQVDEARTAEMTSQREASYQAAVASCPEATDPNTPIGKSLSAVIAEAERTNNPLLYDPQAPELFLAMANARLPETQRVELKRPAAATQTPSGDTPAATVHPSRQSPAGVLPVAASVRSAQPATATIDPSNVDRAIKEMPTSDLEAALLGAGSGAASVLMRL